MCMLTVHQSPDAIVATMNRDEALARGPERAPQLHDSGDGSTWMAPLDSDKGGTWMGANSHGVVACLLNAYLPGESLRPDTSGKFRTRGEIIPALLQAGDAQAGLAWLQDEFRPEVYPSFTLLVASPGRTISYEWLRQGSARVREIDDEWIIRSSAGWDSEEIRVWREERFACWRAAGCEEHDALPSFHVLQDPDNIEWSPLMRREWSATRSITQVSVSHGDASVEMRYWPEPTPDSREAGTHLSVPLSAMDDKRIDAKAT